MSSVIAQRIKDLKRAEELETRFWELCYSDNGSDEEDLVKMKSIKDEYNFLADIYNLKKL